MARRRDDARAPRQPGRHRHARVRPELFYDVGSPYAYLAVERFEAVVGVAPVLRPVLLGGIFKATGRSSWGLTAAREAGMAGIERRALAAGLPPVVWPDPWPGD